MDSIRQGNSPDTQVLREVQELRTKASGLLNSYLSAMQTATRSCDQLARSATAGPEAIDRSSDKSSSTVGSVSKGPPLHT